MGFLVLSFFQLILVVPPKLTLDVVNKGLRASNVLSEEGFKFWPRDGNGAFVAALVLSLSEADRTMKEDDGKGGTIYPYGAWDFEIILTLLTKMVAIHVGFSGVGFRGSSLKWTLL